MQRLLQLQVRCLENNPKFLISCPFPAPKAWSTPRYSNPTPSALNPVAAGDGPAIDATAFYKEVKAALEPQQFRLFAQNIKALNRLVPREHADLDLEYWCAL